MSRNGVDVHIFEKADKVGVDAASVDVTVFRDGKTLDVGIDVPMRSIDTGSSLPERHAHIKDITSDY